MSYVCTVAIPAYNRPAAVCRALESALAQDLPALQVLVVDDCSTDGAWEAVQRYTDPRLRLVRNERNLGLFANFNRCLELAEGKYVRLLCNDDRLVPGCLRHETAIMEQHLNVTIVSAKGYQVDETGKPLRPCANELPPGIYGCEEAAIATLWLLSHYGGSPLNYPSGVLLRREAALRAGGFDTTLKHIGDVDLWLKVARQGDLVVTDNVGCEVLVHEQQTTSKLLIQGEFTREWFLLADRWKPELERHGLYRHVINQSAACSLWLAGYYLRKRRPDIARLYWQVARAQGIAALPLSLSFGKHVWLKLLLRGFHVRLRPKLTFEPLA